MATTPPDQSRFIQDITIRNFKCFEELKIEGCGQFNLILGDNNVGKTSVLEALLVDENPYRMLDALHQLLDVRGLADPPARKAKDDMIFRNLVEFFTNRRYPEQPIFIEIGFRHGRMKSPVTVALKQVNQLSKVLRLAFSEAGGTGRYAIYFSSWIREDAIDLGGDGTWDADYGDPHHFIPASLFPDDELAASYSHLLKRTDDQERLLRALQEFAPDVRRVEIASDEKLGPYLIVRLATLDLPIALEMMGEGTRKLFRILLETVAAQDDRLMIDEIDAGIHYSRFATLWRTTLLAAIANNVQLFITTHNNECLRALAQVLETEEFAPYRAECRAFTLRRLPDGSTKAYQRDFEHAMENDYEIRGGQL